MNFIFNHQYSDGNTPIRPEGAEQLIPKISTMKELNEYEALNILEAQRWAFSNRTMNSTNPLLRGVSKALYAEARSSGVGHDAARAFRPGKLVADAYQNVAGSAFFGKSEAN